MWRLIDEATFAVEKDRLLKNGGVATSSGTLMGGGTYLEWWRGGVSVLRRESRVGSWRYFVFEVTG